MKLLTLTSLDGHININVCKYGTCVSLTLDNGRFPTVRWFWGKKETLQRSQSVSFKLAGVASLWTLLIWPLMLQWYSAYFMRRRETGAPWFYSRGPRPVTRLWSSESSKWSERDWTRYWWTRFATNCSLQLTFLRHATAVCVYRLLFPLYSRKWQFLDVMLAESSRHCNAHCVL